jgi:hypothetical protein
MVPSPRWRILTAVTMARTQRGIGSVYGTSRERAYDRWFRYPAGFSPEALELALAAVAPARGSLVVDPFFGAGTASSVLAGSSVVGIEAHPLIAELAATKLARPPGRANGLRRAAHALAARADWLTADAEAEHTLVRRCFDPAVLKRLVAMRDALDDGSRSPWRRYLRWALLGTLRDVASVKVGWPYQRPAVEREAPHRDPVARMLERAEMIAVDLENGVRPSGRVVRGDARSARTWRRAASTGGFDGCITSPPYLNNFDYADATRLELYFLGTVSSWAQMCGEVRSGMMVASTQQSGRRHAERALVRLRRYESVYSEVAELTTRLGVERGRRPRGKEYDQVLPAYFADLARVLVNLHTNSVHRARAAWLIGDSAPYGVHVDTPRLAGALARDVGFALVDDVVVRSRGLRWRTNGSRHQVPLTERLITLQRI